MLKWVLLALYAVAIVSPRTVGLRDYLLEVRRKHPCADLLVRTFDLYCRLDDQTNSEPTLDPEPTKTPNCNLNWCIIITMLIITASIIAVMICRAKHRRPKTTTEDTQVLEIGGRLYSIDPKELERQSPLKSQPIKSRPTPHFRRTELADPPTPPKRVASGSQLTSKPNDPPPLQISPRRKSGLAQQVKMIEERMHEQRQIQFKNYIDSLNTLHRRSEPVQHGGDLNKLNI